MERGNEDEGNAFRIPDLWVPSQCLKLGPDYSSFLFSNFVIDDIDVDLPDIILPTAYEDPFFSAPDLALGAPHDVRNTTSQGHLPTEDLRSKETLELPDEGQSENDDIWLLSREKPLKTANYQSWDAFEHEKLQKTRGPYITEAGAQIFDAAARADNDFLQISNSGHGVVDAGVYVSALTAVGLGRASGFFTWNEEEQHFTPTLQKMRISGCSGESLEGLSSIFTHCGDTTRFLRRFVETTYRKHQSSGQIALADTVSSLLITIETELSYLASTSNSVLQLQALFKPAHTVLLCFRRIVEKASIHGSDESMLSTIFEEAQNLEHRTDSLRDVLFQVLFRVSRPWLEFSSEWLGLRRESGVPMSKEGKSKAFVKVEEKEWINEQGEVFRESDYSLDHGKIPSFMAPEDAHSLFEVGRSLRLLKTHHPDHPLSKPDTVEASNPPSLSLHFSWEDIAVVEKKAVRFEADLVEALKRYSIGHSVNKNNHQQSFDPTYNLEIFGKPVEEMQAHVLASIDALNQLPIGEFKANQYSMALTDYLRPDFAPSNNKINTATFAPPISLIPLLSFNPIISAQARIVNGTCLQMFFNSHNLREHLFLQKSFHLLGNGVFSSRLSHALFDPELETAERHRGVARSGGVMGLRLGGRDTWPPASSELRLALMGVLTESYTPVTPFNKSRSNTFLEESSLPGDLSFAVRDMSEQEIQKCLNPDSNEALDFLRLSYKAPAPLDAVITPMILFKYDQIFRLLLRVLRMLYVVSAMFRDASSRNSSWDTSNVVAHRFRVEAQHFISSISGYFFETGINATWRVFERKLDQVERMVSSDKIYTLGPDEGIDRLRDYHEMVLDKIMFSLLLRKRQQAVMTLLEDIFTLILQFSKSLRQQDGGKAFDEEGQANIVSLYTKFRQSVGVFVNVCRGMSEKKGFGEKPLMYKTSAHQSLFDGNDLGEENTITQLMTRLDMFDYYSKS